MSNKLNAKNVSFHEKIVIFDLVMFFSVVVSVKIFEIVCPDSFHNIQLKIILKDHT